MWERRLVDWMLRRRALVLAVIAVITTLAAWSAARVEFDADIESWFLEGDESLVRYHAFLERFEADEIAVLGVFAPDVFEPGLLAGLHALTEALATTEHVNDVTSITNVKVVAALGPGSVAVGPLMEALPEDAEAAAALRDRAMAYSAVRDSLLAKGGTGTALVVQMHPDGNNFDDKVALVRRMQQLATEHLPPGTEWVATGSPVLDEAMFVYTERDFTLLGPLAGLVVLLSCFALFRRFTAALIPLAVVGLALTWLFGLMGAVGLKITLLSSGLMALVLAVGVADAIHVLADYYRATAGGESRDEAVAHATASLIEPCAFTSATTAAGFLSLTVSDLQPVAEFGALAAVGVVFAFLLSMTVIPCVLGWLAPPDAAFLERQRTGPLQRLLDALGRPSRRSARVTLAVSAVLVGLAGLALTTLNTDANPMNYFLEGDPVRDAMLRVDEDLGGSSSVEFIATTGPDGLKKPEVLARLADFQHRMEGVPGVTRVLSVLDSLKETRSAFSDGEETHLPGPDDHPHLAAQLYIVLEGDEDFSDVVKDNYTVTRMTARVQLSKGHLLTGAMPQIEGWIQDDFSDDALSIEATGYIKLMSDMETYLFRTQVESLLVAFVVILLMLGLLLRSPTLALFSMIPNYLPIAGGLGVMAVAGIALDPGTIMIGSVALGLVVDDTVHFMVRLRRGLGDLPLEDAIDRAMHHTGRPIILTSFVLAGGFATMGFGSFTPNVAFGLVAAAVILMAVVCDLVVLPAALLVLRPRL